MHHAMYKPTAVRYRKRKFVISGNNGNSLIESSLLKRGWEHSENDDMFTLKWTEIKAHINYDNFIEGKQMVNHIPSSGCVTTKAGLLNSLRSYFGSLVNQGKDASQDMSSFFPETYRLGDCRERERLINVMGDNELWICKPTNSNQGKGIFLIKGKNGLLNYLEKRKKQHKTKMSSRIVQRYITNPLLINGRKFDIRVFLLVGSTRPFNVFFHTGYLRLTVNQYDNSSDDLTIHLTNQYMQKKNPNYYQSKDDTVWNMDQFQDYLINEGHLERLGLRPDWVKTDLHDRMKSLAYTVFKSAQTSLTAKIGYFDLYGLDFMLDDSLNVWLIEVNTNPALHTHCLVLQQLLPSLIDETLGICIELFDKKVAGISTFPLQSLSKFEYIFSSARDKPQNSIEYPLFLQIKHTKKQLINRGSDFTPIQCHMGITQKPVKSAPTRRTTRSDKNSETSSKSGSSNITTSKISEIGTKLNVSGSKKEEHQQIPLKLALIEVAPRPKQDVL